MKSFMMSLDQKTLDFLVKWYQLPIQDILRVLAAVDQQEKTFLEQSEDYLNILQRQHEKQNSYDEAVAAARLAGEGGTLQ